MITWRTKFLTRKENSREHPSELLVGSGQGNIEEITSIAI